MDAWINEPEPESDDESRKVDAGSLEIFYKTSNASGSTPLADFRDGYQGEGVYEEPEEVQQVRREARRVEQANNPHYLKGNSSRNRLLASPAEEAAAAAAVPVIPIHLSVPLQVSSSGGGGGRKLSDKYLELERQKESSSSKDKKHRSNKRDKKKKKKKGIIIRIVIGPIQFSFD